jgi:lipid-A-disaccharide synthase
MSSNTKYLKNLILSEKPDLALLIDSQGFNLPLAKFCKSRGIRTAYYIPPQEWLWGTPEGVKNVAENVDLIIAIFEREYKIYKQAGAKVIYFGHPLLDMVKPTLSLENARLHFLGSSSVGPVVSLCPGSRMQEIYGLLPILLKAAELIQKELPQVRFLVPAPSQAAFDKINSIISNSFRLRRIISHLKVVEDQTYDVLFASDLALCASGTINLEASLLGVPNIMVYKLSPFTFFIGKHLLKIDRKLKYFSMPNLLLDSPVIPELVMGRANPSSLAHEAVSLLSDTSRLSKMKSSFSLLRSFLGQPGVVEKIAKAILS